MRKRRKKRLLGGFKANLFFGKDLTSMDQSEPKKEVVKRTKPGIAFKLRKARASQ